MGGEAMKQIYVRPHFKLGVVGILALILIVLWVRFLHRPRSSLVTWIPVLLRRFRSTRTKEITAPRADSAVRKRLTELGNGTEKCKSPPCAAKDVTKGSDCSGGTPKGDRERDVTMAMPFLGFSLADNVVEGFLVVDGVFCKGPAQEAGICIDDELLQVAGRTVNGLEMARRLVAEHCIPGGITSMVFRGSDGVPFTVQLRVMTAERRFSGSPFYFDPTAHGIEESRREKKECWSWRNLQQSLKSW